MARLIDADAFFNDFSEIRDYEYTSQEYEIEAVPVKHGHWILTPAGWKCSNCEDVMIALYVEKDGRYCPHCGAKMDEGEE